MIRARLINGPLDGHTVDYCQMPPKTILLAPSKGWWLPKAQYSVSGAPVQVGRRMVQDYRFDYYDGKMTCPRKAFFFLTFAGLLR